MGDPGPSKSAELVYQDATGRFVGRGQEYIDDSGMMWNMALEYGIAIQFYITYQANYTEPDCAGQAYLIEYVLPRAPFRMPWESFYRVRPDTLLSGPITVLSDRTVGGCTNETSARQMRAFPLTPETIPAVPIVTPAVTFAPPLRLAPE
jgi:hypothetical protein